MLVRTHRSSQEVDLPGRGQPWTSFVADDAGARQLHEDGNAAHRLRVEHNREVLLIHLSDEDGKGWTVLAVERGSREWAVAQDRVQRRAAEQAYRSLPDR